MISSLLVAASAFAVQANAASIPASAQAVGLDISTTLQNILANTQNSDGYTYPTDLTRGIVPVSFRTPGETPLNTSHRRERMFSPLPHAMRASSHILTLITETNPLAQRLLARRPCLFRPVRRLCLHRSGRLALQRHSVHRPRSLSPYTRPHVHRPLH